MRPGRILAVAALGLTQACGTGPTPTRWYFTCGDPVCHGHQPRAGVAACTTQREGTSCPVEGSQCDPGDPCNRLLVCAARDPRPEVGCPLAPTPAR